MKLSLFSLQDSTASQFGAPFVAVNDNSAVRSCCVEAANPASGPLHTHPGDFRVFRLGVFDSESGVFELEPIPVFLANVTRPTQE